MRRLGLCCTFVSQPIKFRIATAAHMKKFSRSEQLEKLSSICLHNALSLLQAIEFCASRGIGCFRVNSQFWPLKTHPESGYNFFDLPGSMEIEKILNQCRQKALEHKVRLSFHPDQFVLLSSPDPHIVKKSVEELDYQAEVAEMIGADVINIHAGGGYRDKLLALQRMGSEVKKLKPAVLKRLTLENDDRTYTPRDILPFCKGYKIPLVYDVHHHRCLPDGLSLQEATDAAIKTWNREPLFHISSPKEGWQAGEPRWHHDYIDIQDFPREWYALDITVEIEAKAKELAVLKLYNQLESFSNTITST